MASDLEIIRLAIAQAFEDTIQQILPTVALKTGALRRGFQEMMHRQLGLVLSTITTNSGSLTIRFDYITTPFYAKYHIYGPHGEATRTSYKNPTTAGTKPLQELDVIMLLQKNVQLYVKQAIEAHKQLQQLNNYLNLSSLLNIIAVILQYEQEQLQDKQNKRLKVLNR